MKKRLHTVINIITWIVLAVVVLFAVALVGVRLIDFRVYTVLSSSMEPTYPTGSLIYVKEVDPDELEVGDVITFELSGDTTATHRIIELVPDEENPSQVQFRTKGDNNDDPDAALVSKDRVIGQVLLGIPYLGYVAAYVQTPPGMYYTIMIVGGVLLVLLIAEQATDPKSKTSKKQKEAVPDVPTTSEEEATPTAEEAVVPVESEQES